MEEIEMKKARNGFAKTQSESVINRHKRRLITVLASTSVPGLETVVFEGINGCGKDYLYNKLNDKFKEYLGVELPLYSSKPSLEELESIEQFLKLTEEGYSVKEVKELARAFLMRMLQVSEEVDKINLCNPDWCYKTFDKFKINSAGYDKGFKESKPTSKYIGIMRWTLSNYIYSIQALIGTKEIKRLLDKYFYSSGDYEGFSPYGGLDSLNMVEHKDLAQPMFLYELASNPKVIEFTREWGQLVSSWKLGRYKKLELLPIDNLVYITCSPSLAEERIKSRDKKDISTDSHKSDSLKFTHLMYNALYYCVFYNGSDDDYLEGSNGVLDSIQDQIRTVLYKKERIRYAEGVRGYKYQLTEYIQLLKATFDVHNVNFINVTSNLMTIEDMVDYIFDKIVYKERLDESYRDTLGTEMHPSMVRGRV